MAKKDAAAKRHGQQGRVLRDADFECPKRISEDDFASLCEMYKIPSSVSADWRKRLDRLVNVFVGEMSNDKRKRGRGLDRVGLEKTLSCIKNAKAEMEKLGYSGQKALTSISPFVGPMLAARWLSESVRGGDQVLHGAGVGRSRRDERGIRSRTGAGSNFFGEDETLDARRELVGWRPAETLIAALKRIECGLVVALREIDVQPRAKGGRTPLEDRHMFIVNLCEIWNGFGKALSTGPNSDFVSFCESVFEAVGWPTGGVDSAIPGAIRDWKRRTARGLAKPTRKKRG